MGNTQGAQCGAGEGGEPGRTLNPQEQPSSGGNRAGAEAAQVPAVTCAAPGTPRPALTSFRVEQTSGSPRCSPCPPPAPPARAKFGNGKSQRPRQERRGGLVRQWQPGGHAGDTHTRVRAGTSASSRAQRGHASRTSVGAPHSPSLGGSQQLLPPRGFGRCWGSSGCELGQAWPRSHGSASWHRTERAPAGGVCGTAGDKPGHGAPHRATPQGDITAPRAPRCR